MISEFLWLDFVESTVDGSRYSCSLPAPDPYSDEEMVVCGEVVFSATGKEGNGSSIIIRLFENFKDLCVGDSYQRKNFVQTLIFELNLKYGLNLQNVYIDFSDCWGTYAGKSDSIDEIIRG